jgi:hypothetical protein
MSTHSQPIEGGGKSKPKRTIRLWLLLLIVALVAFLLAWFFAVMSKPPM